MLRVVYEINVEQSLQNINACSSKQCLVSGACIAVYNLATEHLIAVSIAPFKSPWIAHSNATNNSICVICATRALFLYVSGFEKRGHLAQISI